MYHKQAGRTFNINHQDECYGCIFSSNRNNIIMAIANIMGTLPSVRKPPGCRCSSTILRILYLVVGFWVAISLRQIFFPPQIIDLAGVDSRGSKSFDPTRLIFLISMGEQARNSKLVERFVWSARHRGEWQGWIVLLTDAPTDRYSGFSHNLIVMNPEKHHFNTSFREDMPYKRFKTRVIEYIDKDTRLNKVRLIYYLDVDNIVGNSLPRMFEDLENKYSIPGKNEQWLRTIPRMWFFANKYKHISVQGGQFIVDRYNSEPCLLSWREKIDANISESKDQPSLHRIRGNGRNQKCQIVAMTPKKHLLFPSNGTIHEAVDRIQSGEVLKYPALVHIKNSCNTTAKISSQVEEIYVQDIVQNLEFSKKIHVRPDQ